LGVWKSLLRIFGLNDDAQVRINASGIDVVITGDPRKVRAMLGVVRQELENNPKLLPQGSHSRRRYPRNPQRARPSQMVQPTELDELDSPYALPEARVMPVADDDVTAERSNPRHHNASMPTLPRPDQARTLEPGTKSPVGFSEESQEQTISNEDHHDAPEGAATAVVLNPNHGRR
jgi:hypothetical protein